LKVVTTYREHFPIHWLALETWDGEQMASAFAGMTMGYGGWRLKADR